MAGENQIKVKYKYADDYNPQYVNGAQGGINVQGLQEISQFAEGWDGYTAKPIPQEVIKRV